MPDYHGSDAAACRGAVNDVATTAGGTARVTNGFTHVAAPVVKGINPASVMMVGATVVPAERR
jgi:hypothetical protein